MFIEQNKTSNRLLHILIIIRGKGAGKKDGCDGGAIIFILFLNPFHTLSSLNNSSCSVCLQNSFVHLLATIAANQLSEKIKISNFINSIRSDKDKSYFTLSSTLFVKPSAFTKQKKVFSIKQNYTSALAAAACAERTIARVNDSKSTAANKVRSVRASILSVERESLSVIKSKLSEKYSRGIVHYARGTDEYARGTDEYARGLLCAVWLLVAFYFICL